MPWASGVNVLVGVFLLADVGLGQTVSTPKSAFEVYHIQLNTSGLTTGDYFRIEGAAFRAHAAKVSELFLYAFKVRREALIGAPSWFESDRVDITAKATPTTSGEDLCMMLQSLLINEFKLVAHYEPKTNSVFVLVVGKGGLRMRTASGKGRADCQQLEDRGPGGHHLSCTNMTISELAEGLPDLAPGYIDKPVLDRSGSNTAYDFMLEWVNRRLAEGGGGPTIFEAVEKLGLRFDQRKEEQQAIVIDQMARLSNK
jgi:uncharacterized protein (TIGR03435 family)